MQADLNVSLLEFEAVVVAAYAPNNKGRTTADSDAAAAASAPGEAAAKSGAREGTSDNTAIDAAAFPALDQAAAA